MMTNICLPVFAKAENSINQQNFYATTVDKNEFYNQIKKQVDFETFKQIVALMEGSGYWFMEDNASKDFIRRKVATLPQLSSVFAIQKNDNSVVSKKTKFFIPDDDPISVNLGLNDGSSTTNQVMTGIANSLGLPIGDMLVWLNDSRIYQQHPFIFGAIFTNYMREYNDGTQKTNPKDIFKTDTINWLYSPVGYLHNYYHNYDLKEFTNRELMTLGSPPGWEADFQLISAEAMIQVAISVTPMSAVVEFFQSIFKPLAKYIPQPISKMIAFLKTEVKIPKIPTGATPFVKRTAVADTGPLLSQATTTVAERETYTGSVNSIKTSELPYDESHLDIFNLKTLSYSESAKESFPTKLDISQINWASDIFQKAQGRASLIYEKYGVSSDTLSQIFRQSFEKTRFFPQKSQPFVLGNGKTMGIYFGNSTKEIGICDESILSGDFDTGIHEYQHYWDDILSTERRNPGPGFKDDNTLHASVEARSRYIYNIVRNKYFNELPEFHQLSEAVTRAPSYAFDLMHDRMFLGFAKKIAENKRLPMNDKEVIKLASQLADSIYEEILFASRDAGVDYYFLQWSYFDKSIGTTLRGHEVLDKIINMVPSYQIKIQSINSDIITQLLDELSNLAYKNYDEIVNYHTMMKMQYSSMWR